MDLQRALRYDDWANRQTLDAIKRSNSPSKAVGLLAHMVAVNQLWLSRASGGTGASSMWPQWTLTKTEAEMESCFSAWVSCTNVDHLNKSGGCFHYLNSKGERCSNTFEEVILELLAHSAHHRGQVALLLRQDGFEPPASTDFIPALRAQCF